MEDKVLIVIAPNGDVIHVGDPDKFNPTLISDYAKSGYTIKTISIKQYREWGVGLYEPFPNPQTQTNETGNG